MSPSPTKPKAEGVELPEEETPATADETTSTDAAGDEKKESKKQPLPEGHITPTALAHVLTERWRGLEHNGQPMLGANEEVRPQIIYGYVKNGSGFPHSVAPDGRRMVNEAEAIEWCDERRKKYLDRLAAKAKEETEAKSEGDGNS